jgi:hypothetical protein
LSSAACAALGDDVDAITAVLNYARHTSKLTLDALEAMQQRLFTGDTPTIFGHFACYL